MSPKKRRPIHALRRPVLIWHASVVRAVIRRWDMVNALDLGGTLASPARSQRRGRGTSALRRTRPPRPGTGALCRYEWLWRSFAHAPAEGRSSAAALSMSRRILPRAPRSSSKRRRGRPRRAAPPTAIAARSCGAPCAGRPASPRAGGSPLARSPRRCRRPTSRRPTRRPRRFRPRSARAAARPS